jgi:hypothetical protein
MEPSASDPGQRVTAENAAPLGRVRHVDAGAVADVGAFATASRASRGGASVERGTCSSHVPTLTGELDGVP